MTTEPGRERVLVGPRRVSSNVRSPHEHEHAQGREQACDRCGATEEVTVRTTCDECGSTPLCPGCALFHAAEAAVEEFFPDPVDERQWWADYDQQNDEEKQRRLRAVVALADGAYL